MITPADIRFLERLDKKEPHAKCLRAVIAAIIVKNGKILVEHANDWHKEYNCGKIGCIRNEMNIPSGHRREICYGICAEQWCLALAASKGVSVKGATIYVSKHPCRICASMIAISGIKRVVYQEGYPDAMKNFDILAKKKIKVDRGPETAYKSAKRPPACSI